MELKKQETIKATLSKSEVADACAEYVAKYYPHIDIEGAALKIKIESWGDIEGVRHLESLELEIFKAGLTP